VAADWEDAPAGGGGEWETAPKPRPLTGRMAGFIGGNLNKGIAGTVDAVLNVPNEVMNLGKAAFGTAATAADRPDLAPDVTPNPDLARRGMEKAGLITKDADAETTGQKIGAFGLEMAGGMSVPIPAKKPGAFTEMKDAATKLAAERQAQRATLDKTLQEGRKAGFVAPPSQVSSSLAGNVVEGMVARTAPTERAASVHNAKAAGRVIRRDLGLQADQPVTAETLSNLRKDAGQAYAAVKGSGVEVVADQAYKDALGKLKTSDYGKAAAEFPEVLANEAVDGLVKGLDKAKMSPEAAVELTKELRRRATKNIKAWDNVEKQDLGYAQRAAADAIEELIDRNLSAAGKPKLVKEWREARTQIAKVHDAESVFDAASGTFSARELGKLADKGKPLSGGMKQVAEFALAFPRITQDAEKIAQKSGVSQYDMWAGVGAAVATGQPAAAAVAAVPWLTQRALLSPAGQRIFGKPDYSVGLGLRSMSQLDPAIQRMFTQGVVQGGQD
jgi:hypothetical protein